MSAEQPDRIEQFRRMAEADPGNEVGHFSLGKALLEAGRYAEAAAALKKTVGINPRYSKAYQLLGESLARAGNREAALEALHTGVFIADQHGDRQPREAMARLITELGGHAPAPRPASASTAPPPAAAHPAAGGPLGPAPGGSDQPAADEGFRCTRCGRPTGRMSAPPFRGDLGRRIAASVCQTCWREWIGMGTKVINEMGLQLSDPRAQGIYDEHMLEFLHLE